MIDLYTWVTPNGRKIHIALEELGLSYNIIPIDISKGAQFESDFVTVNPNAKIPAIVDHEGPGGGSHAVIESGAILLYLAEKTGKLLAHEGRSRYEAINWLMFQHSAFGPAVGQFHHFLYYAPEQVPPAIERYSGVVHRAYEKINRHLADREFLAGDYTIADIAFWPWVRIFYRHEVDVFDYPNLNRWFHSIALRPAVERAMEVLAGTLPRDSDNTRGKTSAAAQSILWGDRQYGSSKG